MTVALVGGCPTLRKKAKEYLRESSGRFQIALTGSSLAPGMDSPNLQPKIPDTYAHLFRLGHSVNSFEPVGGNCASFLADSNATIDSMVADIDAAQDHVHLITYIWLPDNNGLKVVEALKRAATRRVACRVMADGLGSHIMILPAPNPSPPRRWPNGR